MPGRIVDETSRVLSSKQGEVFAIWTTSLGATDDVIRVSRLLVPAQDSHETAWGAYVHISGDELSRIAFDNYDRGERNAVQLHTHPSANVNMSHLDREWEVVVHSGALSIIVPDYGRRGLVDFPGANIYEREGLQWRLWDHKEVSKRIKVSK